MAEYYSKYCKCGCGQRIEIKKSHKNSSIPDYINSHQRRGKKHSKETKLKISRARKKLGYWKGNKNPKYRGKVEVICIQCGKVNKVKCSLKDSFKFCNRECRANWEQGRKQSKEWVEKRVAPLRERKRPDISKRLKEAYALGIMTPPMLGKIAWNKGLTMETDNRILGGKDNPRFGKLMKPHFCKYKNINMRSTWEAKYAEYLDKQGVKWKYEPKHFDLGYTTYTPDFRLSSKVYVEIKGWMSPEAYFKIKKFLETYPHVELQILIRSDLVKLGIL